MTARGQNQVIKSSPRQLCVSARVIAANCRMVCSFLTRHDVTWRFFLRSVDRVSRYDRVKKNQLDAQLILSIFLQPLHVSGLSRPIIRRYNRMYTTIGTYSFYMNVCYPGWIEQYFLKFAIRRALHNSQWKVILLSVPRH